jgi:alkylhydroperoxidase/carboxymuconolactone decarboxylase family protein YurZ
MAHERERRIPLKQEFQQTLGYWNHLWASGVRTHIRAAFQHGAEVEEIVEVLELTSSLGTQSVTFGLPILLDEASKLNTAT